MAHVSNNAIDTTAKYIEQINVGGVLYDIHDRDAIHNIEDLNLGNVFQFKGAVDKVTAATNDASTVTSLDRITDMNVGDVYHVNENAIEYVYVKNSEGVGSWEPLGGITNALPKTDFNTFVSQVYGKHGHNCSGEVTASGSVANTVGTITKKKLGVVNGAPTVTPTTDKVLGADTTFTVTGGTETTKVVSATASGTAVSVEKAEAITEINLTKNPFVTTVTPSKDAFATGVDTTNSKTDNFVKGYNNPSTQTVMTGLGTASTKAFLTGLGTASTTKGITALGTPTTAAAITGFGDHTTTAFIKAAGLSSASVLGVKTNTEVTVPVVSTNGSVSASKLKTAGSVTAGKAGTKGTACTMSVSGHVLTLTPNTPTTPATPTSVTLPTFDTVTATNTTFGTVAKASLITTETKQFINGIKEAGAAEAITALGTPTTAAAITGFGTHTTKSFVTGYNKTTSDSAVTGYASPATATVIKGLGTPTTAAAITEVALTTANAVTDVTTSTASAVTGEGTPTKAEFVTSVAISAQPTIAVKVGTATGSSAKVVTAVSDVVVTANTNDNVDALTAVSVAAPTATVINTATAGPEVVTDVGTKNTTVNVSGTHSCTTSAPVSLS